MGRTKGTKAKKDGSEKIPTSECIEKLALNGIISGFNQLSCSIPSIALWYLDLEGLLDETTARYAMGIAKKVVGEAMAGKNLRLPDRCLLYHGGTGHAGCSVRFY